MSIIVGKGVIRDGQVVVDEPINLPDGSEVMITGSPRGEFLGQEDNDGQLTPEEINATLKAMDKLIPFEMTPEEEAALAADRQAREKWEKDHFTEQADKLRRLWE